MRLHGNARTCLHSRLLIVRRVCEQGWTLAQAAEAAGASVRTVSKWLRRFREEGEQGLVDQTQLLERLPRRREQLALQERLPQLEGRLDERPPALELPLPLRVALPDRDRLRRDPDQRGGLDARVAVRPQEDGAPGPGREAAPRPSASAASGDRAQRHYPAPGSSIDPLSAAAVRSTRRRLPERRRRG
jgi:transposase-like protein